jgi:hypothetical protein
VRIPCLAKRKWVFLATSCVAENAQDINWLLSVAWPDLVCESPSMELGAICEVFAKVM